MILKCLVRRRSWIRGCLPGLVLAGLAIAGGAAHGADATPREVAQTIQERSEFNAVFFRNTAPLGEDEVFFAAEIPRGDTRKFEMRTATGQVIVDRTLCPRPVPGADRSVAEIPGTYGFSAGRFNVDGDPLDLVVLGREELYERMIHANRVTPQRVRVVGVLRMEECEDVPCSEGDWENDWKIIAVDPEAPEFRDVRDVSELPEERLAEFDEFWSNYKGLSGGYPQTRVRGTAGREAAIEMIGSVSAASVRERKAEISRCDAHAESLLHRKSQILSEGEPPPDREFVECLGRVFSPAYFESRANYDFLLQYGAYQLLRVELEEQDTPLAEALARMDALRESRKTHYRFVASDSPSPGSGNAILEWVKTKDRNTGCPADFPPQHYEGEPLTPAWESLVPVTGPLAGPDSADPA